MDKDRFIQQTEDYMRIEKAIRFIETHFRSQPPLEEIAAGIHLSKYHFNRLFKRWAGITPMQFQQFLTLGYAKQKLMESKSLLNTALDAGLSGTGRLHDLFVTFESMTPGEFKKQGYGLTISCGFAHSPFGTGLIGMTDRGICFLGFINAPDRPKELHRLYQAWPGAEFKRDDEKARQTMEQIFPSLVEKQAKPFHLLLKGTNFQVNVWKALLTIPKGMVACYQDIAGLIGKPTAHRAVASAVAINPVSYLIPCHRVIAKNGRIHQYRWGAVRKKAIIGWEAAILKLHKHI